jgi:methionine sulfoxide reductase heme-binding subunit
MPALAVHQVATVKRFGIRFSSGLSVAVCAVLMTAVVAAWILYLQSQGRSPAALNMPDMGMADVAKFWAFPVLQASGLIGLLFAYVSMLLGLCQSRGSANSMAISHRLHRQIALAVIGLVLTHVGSTILDAMGNTWESVLIPDQVAATGWPAATWGFNLGIVAVYVLLLVAPTFYLRAVLGRRRWQLLHRFVLVFYVLSIWHALILGLEVSYYGWIRPMVWLGQIPVLVLLMLRIRRSSCTAVGTVAVLAIVVIVVSGNAGFIQTV